ncbi:oxygen-regulated protein 1 [Bufo gargarizans]|uniref:oxygen-regulated protein 1 n=1 Tax=Bufo gargarizans TaxID=30331 RepID=UPI001CF56E02|nr:oxygen-regulated protein 1 [Bufo gargarizans]
MSETTSTNISVVQADSTDSIPVSSTRYSRMTDPSFTKRICFYKSGDPRFNGIKMVVSNRSFKTFDALLDSLSKKVPLPFGVRNITTPRGIHHITTLEELADGKSYICSHQRKIKPINLERASKKPLLWQSSRPISARRRVRQLTRQNEVAPFQKENTVVLGSSKNFVIFKNGDKECKHSLVLNKKYIQNFDVFLDQISDVMQFPVYKLYSTDGRRILSTHALLLSSGTIVAAGREPFKPGNYESEREFLPAKLPGISHRVFPKSRSKQEMKSPGKWKVSVFTSEMPLAGTTSQVYIIFYGHLRASAPVFLYSNEEDIFQSGHEDTFDISIGDIGEVYKIRIGHTNSGASPGWHCQEVQLLNIFSNEQFCIKVNRWLARDKEDGEICREIPLLRHDHSKLPVTNYKIEVETGDLWNAGTEANVYIVLQGQYGDTGSRHLHKSNKPTSFAKGQTDTFYLEAVHLGDLRTVIVGHDGLESGNGWYLEKVIVHDEVKDKEYTFLCHRWLDEGEDDGKIVRKLSVTDEADFPARYELEAKKKETWAAEKWKYQNKNCLQLYCRATGRFIRLTSDGKVDALGDKKDKHALFDVLVKRGKVRVFRSHHLRHLALAIDKGVVAAMDNSGILCELQLHIQPNRCVTLESTRIPGMTITFNSDGEPARDDTRGYADIAKEFSVHVKGMFHSGAVLLLATSWSQALCLRSDGSCSGAGKQKVEAYWRVHKTGPAVCMFESVTYPRGFLQIKNGSCNGEGTGDEYCQFKVEKNYENGSVTLESIRSKGIYIGLLPNGFAKPMIHTGEKNIVFYPQVIKFGREKPMGTSATLSQKTEELLLHDEVIEETLHPVAQSPSASPPSSKSARRQSSNEIPPYTSNDWKVSVLTGTSGTSANVTLWVYGSKGSTGPITLGKGNQDNLFQPRQEDQFKVEIPSIGNIYKIRIGQDGSGDHHEWELKQTLLPPGCSGTRVEGHSSQLGNRGGINGSQLMTGRKMSQELMPGGSSASRDSGDTQSERSVGPSLRSWTIPKLSAELRRRGIPFPASARKAELSRLLMADVPPVSQDEVSMGTIQTSLTQLHAMINSMASSMTDLQTRMESVEARSAAAASTAPTPAEPPAGQSSASGGSSQFPTIAPSHFIPANIRQDILEGKDVNLASLLIATHEAPDNRTIACGEVSVILKSKDARLNRKLNVTEFVLAFSLYRDVICTANPHRRAELDLYMYKVVELGYKYGGTAFFDYHRSFSAKAAAALVQCQHVLDWSNMDTELFCRHFAGLKAPTCTICNSYSHTTGLLALPQTTFECDNLQSAARDPEAVTQLIQTELDRGYLIGPFNQPPFACWRVNPVGIVTGKFNNKKRLIYDLSAPHSLQIPSLNSLIPSEEFSMRYASIDEAIQVIIKLGKGTFLSKADITDAFKLLPIHPELWQWHGMKWQGAYYFASKLTFGSKSSPWLFDQLASALHWVLTNTFRVNHVIHYLDDFLLLESPEQVPLDLQVLRTAFSDLKVPLASHKVEGPSTEITFLGIRLNTVDMKASLPPDKLARIKSVVHRLAQVRVTTRADLQSLLGMLNFAMRIMPQGLSRGRSLPDTRPVSWPTIDGVAPFLEMAKSLMSDSLSSNTRKAYTTAWRLFNKFKVTYPPAGEGPITYLLAFTAFCHSQLNLSFSTINLYLAGIQHHWYVQFPDQPSLFTAHPIRSLLRGIQKQSIRRRPTRRPFTGNMVRTVSDALANHPFGQYISSLVRAALYLAFYGFLRPGEFTCAKSSSKFLRRNQLRWDGTLLTLSLDSSKTGRPGESVQVSDVCFPVVKYKISVYTGHLEEAGTEVPVYICLYGERGDSGRRILSRPDLLRPFQQGQVDVFEIEAVSLGKLQSVLLGCEANHKSQYWYCEKVIIREQGELSEYIFNCERWLPYMSQGSLHSEIELLKQETELSSEVAHPTKANEGDWKITLVTGNFPSAGTDATVFLHVYGTEENSGPIMLGSGSHQLFNANSADTFQINLKSLHKPYKIRIGHDNSEDDPDWYLEEVKLHNLSSNQEFNLPVNRWLGENHDDGDTWRELLLGTDAMSPRRAPLTLLDYEIQVYTGDISDADAESSVYINVFGTRGDSGKRKLHKSKFQTAKFQKGQVDIFCIQAVSLGTLQKIHINCDGSKNGNGWFLDKVTIQYEEDGNNHSVLFPCSRWFDEKQDDGRTERELFALERENPEEDIEGKLWNIQITTANDSLLSDEMKVNVIIYGSHGKTNDIFLPQNSDRRYFFPGSKDEFLVKIKDIGEIYKIRIVCDHVPSAPGWHLTSIEMVEQETRQEMQFDSNCWLFVDAEEAEVIKEFPLLSNQQELIPVNQYIVSVHIGDHWGAETFANVYITLYGERGDSGARQLYKSSTPGDKFTRNKVDTFELEAVSLGQLRKVVLGHDREGYGAGMHLKMVTIKESQDSLTEWVFPFWNWLDSHLALYQTVCKLYTAGKRLSTSPIPITQLGGVWIIDITGSGFENAENLNSFSLSFYGNEGKVQVETTISGDELQVKDELQVGTIFKVQVSWSHIQVFKSWYLSSVHMKHTVTNQEMWLSFQCWMMPNEDRCIEIPALYPHKDPLPVVEYTISIHTGDQMSGRSTGRMYICIEGEHGDTGNRVLNVSDVDIISFTKGQVDLFTIKAVYLGQLQKMTLGFNNLESDSWFLEKIVVKEDYTCSRHTFHYNDWITSLSEQEFTESVIMMTETTVEPSKLNPFNTPTNGKWQLRVLGTPTLEKDMDLSVVVFGKNGKSSQQSVTNLNWDPFLLSVGNIGNIIKASFLSTGLSSERRLHLQKIRMRDVDTKQEIGFYPDKVYLPGEDCSENVAEVAAVLPNQPPLDEVTYSVYIRTGDFPASSTAADVFITIYGENGDSCKRRLINSLTPKVFGKGKINFFKVKSVDLGPLSGVHIEHDAVGYGAGWYLDQITIQKSDKADIKYLFPCRRWLDTAINDKQTDCELKLLGKFSRTNEKLLTSTEGIMNIIVMTDDIPNTGTNSTVYLTICCDQGSYEPVVFGKEALKKGKSIQTVELNGSLGSIQKVRLEMEDDEKDNSWFCKMVQLEHVQSGDILEFPFLQTFGSKENNLVAELPVLKPSGPFLTVKTYYISISIHQAPKPNTDTDLFITLSGTMGNTGRRRVTCKQKALSSKTVGFQLKTVDVGVIHKLLIEKGKQTNLQLEKAVVEEGSFIKNKYIFAAQPWKKEKTNMISMTLQVTEIKNGSSSGALLNENQSMTSDGEWKIYLFSSSEEIQISEILQNNLQWSIVFYGDKGRSNPLRLEEQNLDQWKWKDRLTYKVNLSHDLGDLFKVRLGTVNWHEDLGRLSLHHLNMQNTRTLDTFNQSINKTLPLSLSGDKWIEVPVEWPLRASLSAVTYSVTVFVSDTSEQKNKLNIGVCLHGKHGDTGHRYINWQHVINGEEDESFTAILDAVELGEVHQADISMSSSDDCKLHIKRIHVKESSRNKLYVFNVNESFSIQREKPETRIEVVISQVVRDQQGETDNGLLLTSDPTGTVEENLVQHKIIVYTGDIRGAGTDANVYIILFYDNGFSIGPVWLKEPQEESKPFQNGKVDTFIIATKTIGRFSHIEIGHDGKGLGNGWFLEKVEIVAEFKNEKALFSCNRWLAEDEDDGRTVIQLYR